MITSRNTVFDIHFPAGDPAPGVSPFSARGLKGTLSPIDLAAGSDHLRRTVNGTLIDVSAHQMRKYQLEIHGSDWAPPAFDGLWLGMEVVVDSNVELGYLTTSGGPARTPVSGSSRVEGAYTFYCPQFIMRVVELELEQDEWATQVDWSLTLEEV